tara:strand:+ start:25338 stop:26117 length:780 start_codon:yes stop_codon:yes gene_type:complete
MKSNNINLEIKKFFESLPNQINLELKKFKKISVRNKKKEAFDPVTNIDKNIEKFIRKKISNIFPHHKILGEEMKDKRTNSDYTWIIDPIDGTKNFLMGMPVWSNLIGLFHKNISIAGLANYPVLNVYYLSLKGKTFKYNKNKKMQIKCNKKTNKNIKIVINTLRTYKDNKVKKIERKQKGIFKITGMDSLNFCLLAEGKIDLIIEKGLKKVDFFPLISIIENSGAIITDWTGKKIFKNGDVLVSGSKKKHLEFLNVLNS